MEGHIVRFVVFFIISFIVVSVIIGKLIIDDLKNDRWFSTDGKTGVERSIRCISEEVSRSVVTDISTGCEEGEIISK